MMNSLKEIKNAEIKNGLITIYEDKSKWNKLIDIKGYKFIYISVKNEFRIQVDYPSKITVALLVGCIAHDHFMWCC